MTIYERFWSKVDKTGDCWEWKAGKIGSGYGQFKCFGKDWLAHRLAFLFEVGGIGEGMFVCHHCDNPPCVRPDHLFLGTNSDNIRDAVRKNRWPRAGEKNGRAKLTLEQVEEIRQLPITKDGDLVAVARRYGVDAPAIYKIRRGKTWRNVQL